ncbi:hypothetical protein [Granulicoccus phenolivorans]|uniref:hypothetical protein n=1 Tax=Granulicoccus phenolivorans TaxID=266854 RepID=UPI000AFBA1D9|nr:hypothetical protein [Granulicoccus phenolivorans]
MSQYPPPPPGGTPPPPPGGPGPQGYPGQGYPGSVPREDPGKTMGLVGLILAIVIPLVGLIVSIIARGKSKAAGFKNTLATVGIIIGAVFLLGQIIGGIVMGVSLGGIAAKCAELGPGTHVVGGVTYTCN